MAAIGAGEKGQGFGDARGRGARALGVAGANGVAEAGYLVLAGFDDEAQQRQRIGERAQLGERDAGFGARHVGEVDAERVIPLAALDLGRRLGLQRLLRPEPALRPDAGDRVARRGDEPGENVGPEVSLDSVGRHGDPQVGREGGRKAFDPRSRHCEERSDVAIGGDRGRCLMTCGSLCWARNDGIGGLRRDEADADDGEAVAVEVADVAHGNAGDPAVIDGAAKRLTPGREVETLRRQRRVEGVEGVVDRGRRPASSGRARRSRETVLPRAYAAEQPGWSTDRSQGRTRAGTTTGASTAASRSTASSGARRGSRDRRRRQRRIAL